jgi:hypothetical protein
LRLVAAAALDVDAWRAALAQRALPGLVPVMLVVIVAGPLAVAGWQLGRLGRALEPRARMRVLAGALLGGAVVGHLHLAVLITRSEAILRDDPARMIEARLRMHPAHEATVRRIADHHALLKARLGDSAAP